MEMREPERMDFREQLKYHIKENGFTNYEFARVSGLDRVNIQRYISGKRIPSEATFHTILEYLRLSVREREELVESYRIAVIGENLYYQRKYIKDILEKAGNMRIFEKEGITLSKYTGGGYNLISGTLAVERFVEAAISDALRNEKLPFLYLFTPAADYEMLRLLPSYRAGETSVFSRLSIIQLLELTKRTDLLCYRHHNLRVFGNILPCCMAAGSGYQAYYYYKDSGSPDAGEGCMYPFYAILNNRVILFSQKMDRAISIVENAIVVQFATQFQEKLTMARKMTERRDNEKEIWEYLLRERPKAREIHFLQYQPCFGAWAEESLSNAVLNRHVSDQGLISRLTAGRTAFESHQRMIHHYFTKQGLLEFVDTGRCMEFPEKDARAFHIKERVRLLEGLRHLCETDESVRMVSSNFRLTRALTVYLSAPCGLNLICAGPGRELSCITIHEETLENMFADFISSMGEAGMLQSREETINLIRGCEERLKKEG